MLEELTFNLELQVFINLVLSWHIIVISLVGLVNNSDLAIVLQDTDVKATMTVT